MKNNNQDHSELVQKILSGTRWATILRVIAQVFTWLSTIIVVRFIMPEDYGLNSMLEAPLGILTLFSTLGLDLALVQRKEIKHDELSSVFGFLLLINVTLFLVFFFGGFLLASYFSEPRLEALAKVLAFVFLLVPFRVIPNALLDRALDFKLKAQIELVASIFAAITILILAYLGNGVWALVIGLLVNRALLAILLMVIKPWFIFPSFNFVKPWKMMKFGGVIMLGALFALMSDMLVTWVAGPQIGTESLGIYVVAATFAMLPLSKSMPIINQTIIPAFSKFQEHRSSATYYLEKLFGVVTIVFMPIMVGLACVSSSFVLTVIGEKWTLSILPLSIMSIGVIFRMSRILYKPVMTSMGRPDLSLKLSFLQLALLFPMTILAIDYGVIGLVIVWVLTEFIIMMATIHLSKQVLDSSFKRFFYILQPAVISSVFMAVCVMGIKPMMLGQTHMLILIVQIIVGILAYFLMIRLFYMENMKVVIKTFFGDRFTKYM